MGKIERPKIILEQVKSSIVDHYLVHYGLSTDGELGQKVERLQAHQEKVAKKDLGECSVCGGHGDVKLPVCPYCGVGDEEAQLSQAVAANPNATIATKHEEPMREKRKPATSKPNGTSPEPTPATTALAQTTPTDIRSIKDLDKNVTKIRTLKKGAVMAYWELGKEIFKNYEQQLWSLRMTEDGKRRYKAFNQFVTEELEMSISQAYILMDVAVNFSREDVETIGVAKLRLIGRLPAEDRAELLEQVRSHQSPLSEIEEEVRRRVGGTRRESTAATQGGPGLRGGARVAEAGTQAARDAKVAKSGVTVAIALGRKVIPMVRASAMDRAASTINHEPFAEEVMLNGVVTQYRVIKTEDGLSLVIVRKQTKDKGESKPAAPSNEQEEAPKKKRGRPKKA